MRDPYEVLGVGRSASEADIKRAYRKLAKQYHPDKHAGDKRAQAKFSEINAANEIIGDKEKRQKYDRGEIDAEGKPKFQGFEGFHGGPGGGFQNIDPSTMEEILASFGRGGPGGGGGSRTFRFTTGGPGGSRTFEQSGDSEDFLSSMFGGRARASRPSMPGADVRADVGVTLEDIAAGRKPKVTLPTAKTVQLTLPKGVTDGQVIRLQGQGLPSQTGGPPGDALVTVRFVPHPLFKADGADLRLELPIGLDEAVLGAKIPVPTLSGKVHVTIPPGSSSGRTFRLKGKGLPKVSGAGDLLVTPRIVLPESADGELAELMKKWQGSRRSSPRGPAFD